MSFFIIIQRDIQQQQAAVELYLLLRYVQKSARAQRGCAVESLLLTLLTLYLLTLLKIKSKSYLVI